MIRQRANRLVVAAAFAAGSIFSTAASGTLIAYQEGSVLLDGVEQDTGYTHLMSDIRASNSTNMGSDDRNVVGSLNSQGEMRIVMDFALPFIPAGSTIDSASLSIRMPPPGTSDIGRGEFQVQLFEVLADMTESEVTWNDRTGSDSWGTPGGDFSPTILSMVDIDASTDGNAIKTFASSTDFVSAAQSALDGSHKLRLILLPDPNDANIVDSEEFFRVLSDDQVSLADRPTLSIEFSQPTATETPAVPEPATVGLIGLAGLALMGRRRQA